MNTCALFSQPPQVLEQNAENIYKEFTSIYFSMTTTSKMGPQRLELCRTTLQNNVPAKFLQ
jgi:hypothetical protein